MKYVKPIIERCTGCRLCEMACVNYHRENLFDFLPAINVFRDQTGLFFTPNVCSQCTSEFCINVCPTGSLQRDENGIVKWHKDTCIYCKQCVMACEYESIHFSDKKKEIAKCDTCNGEFSCVKTCPYDALKIEEIKL